MSDILTPLVTKTLDDLSPRQREVALLVAEGLHNRVIAERLFIEKHTVKNYICELRQRLGIGDCGEYSWRVVVALWVWSQQR